MKPLRGPQFDPYRIPIPPGYLERFPDAKNDENNGFFVFHKWPADALRVIASNGGGWDHISVSLERRLPTWDEMEWVKRYFFKDQEVAMQLHVTPKDHININPNVLHLWRPHRQSIPLPPKSYV